MDNVRHLVEIVAQRPGGEVRVEGGMGVGLTDQDEREALLDQHLTDRLGRVEVIPENRELVRPIGGGMLLQPAFRGGVFTVLFGMAILRHDKLGRQGDDFILVRSHEHRREHAVGIGGGAIAMGLARTLGAGDVWGAEILRAIQYHQQPLLPRPKRRHLLSCD